MEEFSTEKMAAESDVSSLAFHPSLSDVGKRLDAFLAESVAGWSRARLAKLIEDGDASVNGKAVKPSYKLRAGDTVECELTELPTETFAPENIPLNIVYEDAFLAVVNKPAGMVAHPGAGVSSGTLANALAFHFGLGAQDLSLPSVADEQSNIQNLKAKIGMVHRLDKDTTGLIVVAKNEVAQDSLSKQFSGRTVLKKYVALVHGVTDEDSGKVEAPLARDPRNRLKMAIVNNGRGALSLWKVRERFARFTLLEVEIKTGRTHQIRVHLAHIGHPVVGDATYNSGRDNSIADMKLKKALKEMNRFFLHAETLGFDHPETGKRMEFTAPLPEELENFLNSLR